MVKKAYHSVHPDWGKQRSVVYFRDFSLRLFRNGQTCPTPCLPVAGPHAHMVPGGWCRCPGASLSVLIACHPAHHPAPAVCVCVGLLAPQHHSLPGGSLVLPVPKTPCRLLSDTHTHWGQAVSFIRGLSHGQWQSRSRGAF